MAPRAAAQRYAEESLAAVAAVAAAEAEDLQIPPQQKRRISRYAEQSVAAVEAVAAAEAEDLQIPPRIPTSPPPAQQKQEEETCVWLLQRCKYVCKMTPQVCVYRLISRLISQMLTSGAFRQQPLATACFISNVCMFDSLP